MCLAVLDADRQSGRGGHGGAEAVGELLPDVGLAWEGLRHEEGLQRSVDDQSIVTVVTAEVAVPVDAVGVGRQGREGHQQRLGGQEPVAVGLPGTRG